MAINLTDFDKIWASSSPLTPYSFSDANYEEGWNFVGATPPARQMWDSYFKWSDEKQQYIVNNFLPLAGGTMTGEIKRSGDAVDSTNDTSWIRFCGGTNVDNGSVLTLWGKDHSTNPGEWRLKADDGVNEVSLFGKPDGTLTWNGYNVLTNATVGTVVSNTSSGSISVSVNTATTITSVSLTAGTWVITGKVWYESASVVANKIYGAGINDSVSFAFANDGTGMVHSSSASAIVVSVARTLALSSTKTIYLLAYTNNASTVATSNIVAVRIV